MSPRRNKIARPLAAVLLASQRVPIGAAQAAPRPPKPDYRYCFDIFSNRPAPCVTVSNKAGRWIGDIYGYVLAYEQRPAPSESQVRQYVDAERRGQFIGCIQD